MTRLPRARFYSRGDLGDEVEGHAGYAYADRPRPAELTLLRCAAVCDERPIPRRGGFGEQRRSCERLRSGLHLGRVAL